jgi:hypothetical protein
MRALGPQIAGPSAATRGLTRRARDAPRDKEIEMSKIRRAVIREWMSLTHDKRQSGAQAAAFATVALQRHNLPRSRRTPHEIVMRWLRPRTGRS